MHVTKGLLAAIPDPAGTLGATLREASQRDDDLPPQGPW
jgi:hypothetical protein